MAINNHQHTEEENNIHNHHDHNHDVSHLSKGKLLLVIFFNLIISAAEIVGGLISGSLSLVSDAIHNLSDSISIIFSYLSIRISEKPKSKTKTYGYNRANILTAFINSAALIGISVYLVIEAVNKFFHPSQVTGDIVIIVAVVGLLGNLFSVLVLRKSSKESMNIKSSYLHLISDTLSSVAVIISGIIIKFASAYWVDPVFTILINIVIFRASFGVLKESIDILMQGVPLNINVEAISRKLLGIDGIKESHHIHIWRLDEKNTLLEGHVMLDDMKVSETKIINNAIMQLMNEEFNINHTVIQFESDGCTTIECHI
jgi:cobalt-zinc-cadmium efflux system protein